MSDLIVSEEELQMVFGASSQGFAVNAALERMAASLRAAWAERDTVARNCSTFNEKVNAMLPVVQAVMRADEAERDLVANRDYDLLDELGEADVKARLARRDALDAYRKERGDG